jgi:predicted double-glycine peptidase
MNYKNHNCNGQLSLHYLFLTLVSIFGLTIVFTDISWTQEKDDAFYERMCGPLSLSIICEMLGQKVHPDTIADMTGARDENGKIDASGTSMKELANAAYLLGFKAVGMKMSLQNLKELGTPAIAHTTKNGKNHFLVVERVIKDKFRLIEVDGTTQLMNYDEFSKIWNGIVLVISKPQQTDLGERPNVQVKEVLYDFGYAKHLQTITHNFELKNIGSLPLEILEVSSSCACTAVLLSEKIVPPHQTAKIESKFETKLNRGRQTATIKVRTNDPNTPVIHLTLTGVVAGLARIVPNNIYLRNIENQEEIHKMIEVYDSGNNKLRVKNVTSSSPYITTKLQQIYKDGLVAKIFVTIKPGIPFGDFNEKLIMLTEGYQYPHVEILVRGKVVRPISLVPDQFFMGFVKKGEVARRVARLRKKGPADLKIQKIESNDHSVTATFEEIEPGKEYAIEVTFTAPISETGKSEALIKIYTNDIDQPLLEVPFYAIVK